jgi:tetratricopeptide (TPR) repeat protein
MTANFVCLASQAELRCAQLWLPLNASYLPARFREKDRSGDHLGRHFMRLGKLLNGALIALASFAVMTMMPGTLRAQTVGKYVPVPAGSDADKALAEIYAATDPAQKLALIDKFAAGPGAEGDMVIVADDTYVNYYLTAKNYDKAFEYGDKLFAADPDNLNNGINMVRAASEKGDTDKAYSYGDKISQILKRYQALPTPEGNNDASWADTKKRAMENVHDNLVYAQQLLFNAGFQTKDPNKRAAYLVRFAEIFPDSQYADQAMGVAAASYQQAQNAPKMLEVANGLLAKDPNNIGMLLLIADYYSEKGEQLDKAESSAKKAITALDAAKKPEGVTDEQWQQQTGLQKGLALSALGQVNIQKKNNAGAVDNLRAASPLLKPDAGGYARNQYRLGFALLNLKKVPEAKAAFTEAASVNSPYKAAAQDKLKALNAAIAAKAKS